MKRAQAHWLTLLSAAAVLVAGTSVASAQTTANQLGVTLLKVGSKTYNAAVMNPRPLSKAECADDDLELTFRIEGLLGGTNNPNYLEVWVGNDCDATTRKDSDSGKACTVVVANKIEDLDKSPLTDFKVPVSKICESEGTRTVYILGVKTTDSTEEPSYVGKYELEIDKTAPDAPTSVRGGSGETEIPVNWNADDDADHFLLIWDENASSQASSKDAGASDDDAGALLEGPSGCSSDLLRGNSNLGGELDGLPSGLDGKRIDGKVESTTLDGSNLNGKLAAVAVIAIDLAGNASRVSNVSCVRVVPTTGFWGKYQADGGKIEEGCACSIPGHAGSRSAAWPLGLALGALWLRARRRRS